jgi:DNA-binding CsgD family transcriptional regulator
MIITIHQLRRRASTRRWNCDDNSARYGDIGGVKKTILLYGLLGGVLIAGLKLVEYRFLVVEHSMEIYGGIVAALFSALGIWLGLKLTRKRETVIVREVRVPVEVPVRAPEPFVADPARVRQFGITPREMEILKAIAAGLSTREIAARLFVSENTVKTHSSRLFDKLNARRRTQAVQIAKEAGLIA